MLPGLGEFGISVIANLLSAYIYDKLKKKKTLELSDLQELMKEALDSLIFQIDERLGERFLSSQEIMVQRLKKEIVPEVIAQIKESKLDMERAIDRVVEEVATNFHREIRKKRKGAEDISLLEPPKLESLLHSCSTQVEQNTAIFRGDIRKLDKKFIPELFVVRSDAKLFVSDFIRYSKTFEQDLKGYYDRYRSYQKKLVKHEQELREFRAKLQKVGERGEKITEKEPLPPMKPTKPMARHCVAVVGEAGIGKTNLFCNLCEQFLKSKSPVLFYAGHTIIENPENMILSDLGVPNSDIALISIDRLLRTHGKFLFIFMDAINESENYKHIGDHIASLLKRLGRLDATRIKIFISCRDIEWAVVGSGNRDLVERIFRNQPFYLREFDSEELRTVWAKYSKAYHLKNVRFESLSKKVHDIVAQPLMLRFLCEAYKEDYVPRDIERLDVFEKYWDRKFGELERIGLQLGVENLKDEATAFLFRIVDKMRELKQWEILEYDAEELTGQKAGDYKSAFMRLLSEHIIIYSRIDKRINAKLVGFTYESFFEFVLAKRLYIRDNWSYLSDDEILLQFKSLITETHEYRPIKGVLQYMILFFEREEQNSLHLRMLDELVKTHEGCGIAYETLPRLKVIDSRSISILKRIIVKTTSRLGIYRLWGRDQVAAEVFSRIPDNHLPDVFGQLEKWLSSTNNAIHVFMPAVGMSEMAEKRPQEALRIFARVFSDEQFRWFRKSLIHVFLRTNSSIDDNTIKILCAMACDRSRIVRAVPIQFVRKLPPHSVEELFESTPRLAQNRLPVIRDLSVNILNEIGTHKRDLSLTILRDMEKKETVEALKTKIRQLIDIL